MHISIYITRDSFLQARDFEHHDTHSFVQVPVIFYIYIYIYGLDGRSRRFHRTTLGKKDSERDVRILLFSYFPDIQSSKSKPRRETKSRKIVTVVRRREDIERRCLSFLRQSIYILLCGDCEHRSSKKRRTMLWLLFFPILRTIRTVNQLTTPKWTKKILDFWIDYSTTRLHSLWIPRRTTASWHADAGIFTVSRSGSLYHAFREVNKLLLDYFVEGRDILMSTLMLRYAFRPRRIGSHQRTVETHSGCGQEHPWDICQRSFLKRITTGCGVSPFMGKYIYTHSDFATNLNLLRSSETHTTTTLESTLFRLPISHIKSF